MKRKPKLKVACPKCGSRDIYTRYHAAHETGLDWENDGCGKKGRQGAPMNREHLFRHCRDCQFEWRDPTVAREKGKPRPPTKPIAPKEPTK